MDEAIRDARSSPSMGRRIGVIALAIVLALLITRNTLVELALDSYRAVGLSHYMWPREAALELLDENIVAQNVDWQQHDPATVYSIASDTHRLDPLDNWPFMLAGSLFERIGDRDKAIALFAKSVRLDPRSPAPRLHLIQNLVAARRSNAALMHIIQLAQLRPDQDKLLLQALIVLLVRDPDHRLIARLNAYPEVRNRLLVQASEEPSAEPFMAELLSQPGIGKRLRRDLIDRLAQRGSNEIAYAIWRRSNGAAAHTIFDPNFQGLDGPAAYTWRLSNSSSVMAEFSRDTAGSSKALDVEVFGDTSASATYQTVRIAPGSHRVAITGKAIDPTAIGGTMRWDISCADDDRLLGRIAFTMVPERTTRATDIIIPTNGCAFQTISLTAIPESGSQPFRMRFTRIALD